MAHHHHHHEHCVGNYNRAFAIGIALNLGFVMVEAAYGFLSFDGMTELVIPDNQERQYTFIEEVTGRIQVNLFLKDESLEAKGFVSAEYVH
ncbi:MAG: hypothetical protein ACM37W_19690 [Actinomycetota bacterium]